MRPHPCSHNRSLSRAGSFALSVSLLFSLIQTLHAADGTWTNGTTTPALWSATGNWSGGTPADGSGFTANFNTELTANMTVNMDASHTLSALVFGDTTPSNNWTLTNNGSAANVLTLAGTASITVNAMSTVTNTSSNVTISAVIDGTSGLNYYGNGVNSTGTNNTSGTSTLTLSGVNTYTGATNINSGTIRAANASAFGGVSGGKLTTNVVNIASGARLILGGVNIANTVNIYGSNALSTVSGNSTLSGIVNLNGNTNAYVNNGGNYTLTLSGTLNLSDYTFDARTSGTNNGMVISGTITGSGASSITKNGNGPLTISGDGSAYSGTTSLYAGDIAVGSDTALGTGTFLIAPPNNSSVVIRSSSATAHTIATAISLPTTTNNGNTSGLFNFGSSTNSSINGDLTFTNTTDISLGNASRKFQVYNSTEFDGGFTGSGLGITTQVGTGTLVLNGANTYTGATTINAGMVQLGNGGTTGSLSASSAITVASGAIFAVKRSNAAVQGTDFASAISGAGAFTQAGTGTTTLAAGNTYTGTTTVSAGTLALGASNAFADASNFVMSGGTLSAATFSDTVGTLSLTGNATITLGSGGAFAFADSHLLDWSTNALSITGSFVDGASIRFGTDANGLTGAQLALITINGGAASIDSAGYLMAAAIPEPSTCALLAGAGLLGFACWRRRRI